MGQAKLLQSPALKCYINGHLLGVVTSFSWSIKSNRKPLMGIDTNTVVEFIPTTYLVTGQVGIVRLHGDGGLEGLGVVSFSDSMLLEKYIKIDLIDRVTDKVVFSSVNAVVTDQSWQAQAKSLVTGTFSFEASDYVNEAR